jgi:uncharacterized protein
MGASILGNLVATAHTFAMAQKIVIEVSGRTLEAELSDSKAGQIISSSLPLTAQMSRWGDEYYGSVGIEIPEDGTAREIMEVGEMAYWPPGRALCIFFGPTPASMDDRPRAASPVLPVGRVIAGMENLSSLGASVKMKFTAI